MRKNIILFSFFFLISQVLTAKTIVEFKTGNATVASGGSSQSLKPGMELKESDTLDISSGAMVVIKKDNSRIRIKGPRKDKVSALLSSSSGSSSTYNNLVRGSSSGRGPTMVAGVRAKTMGGSSDADSSKDYWKMLEEKNYPAIISDLRKSKDAEEIFIVGLAYYESGDSKKARKKFGNRRLERSDKYAARAKALEALILIDDSKYRAAQCRLERFLKEKGDKSAIPETYYYLNHASYLRGKEEKAEHYKKEFLERYPEHELAEDLY